MQIEAAVGIPDVKLLRPKKHGDGRGFFSETFRKSLLEEAGIESCYVQDNHSLSARAGTVRGLHFQAPPHGQAKLVRVIRGAILDIAVDLRAGSATYGKHVAVELSAEAWNQIYVPVGFAHGLCTLTADVEVQYKVSAYYAPQSEGGLLWDDPDLGIDWPAVAAHAVLAEKDRSWPTLSELGSPF